MNSYNYSPSSSILVEVYQLSKSSSNPPKYSFPFNILFLTTLTSPTSPTTLNTPISPNTMTTLTTLTTLINVTMKLIDPTL